MVMASVLNINGKNRRSSRAYFPIGIVPPYPKTSAERKKDRNSKDKKTLYLEFYHACLKALQSFPYSKHRASSRDNELKRY